MTGRRNVHMFESRISGDLTIGHTILCHTTGNAYTIQSRAFLQVIQDMKNGDLGHSLHRRCHVFMVLTQWLVFCPRLPKLFYHEVAEHGRYYRNMIFAVRYHACSALAEIIEVEFE